MSNIYNFVSLQQGNSPWMPGNINTVGGYFNIANTVSGAGLGLNDTITATGLIPEGGVKVLQVVVLGSPMDTNGTPTGAFELGDSLTDTNHAARYIASGTMGKTNGTALVQYQNVIPTITSGAYVKGVGYVYTTNENSNSEGGNVDIVLTVTTAPATAATTGVVYVYVTYACVGDI